MIFVHEAAVLMDTQRVVSSDDVLVLHSETQRLTFHNHDTTVHLYLHLPLLSQSQEPHKNVWCSEY